MTTPPPLLLLLLRLLPLPSLLGAADGDGFLPLPLEADANLLGVEVWTGFGFWPKKRCKRYEKRVRYGSGFKYQKLESNFLKLKEEDKQRRRIVSNYERLTEDEHYHWYLTIALEKHKSLKKDHQMIQICPMYRFDESALVSRRQ